MQRAKSRREVDDIRLRLLRRDVEDEDECCDGREDVRSLVAEIRFDKGVLPVHSVSRLGLSLGAVCLTRRNPRG